MCLAHSKFHSLQKISSKGEYDAVITLGCVIRGATSHYDYVCNEVAKGVSKANDISDAPSDFWSSNN